MQRRTKFLSMMEFFLLAGTPLQIGRVSPDLQLSFGGDWCEDFTEGMTGREVDIMTYGR
jgi:hypothetical protein